MARIDDEIARLEMEMCLARCRQTRRTADAVIARFDIRDRRDGPTRNALAAVKRLGLLRSDRRADVQAVG